MRSSESDAFAKELGDVYAFYAVELTAVFLEFWWKALKTYNLSDIRSALSTHMANREVGSFVPKPSDIIGIIEDAMPDPVTKCWNCQGDLAKLGRTKLRMADVCNPCYAAYLRNEWKPA